MFAFNPGEFGSGRRKRCACKIAFNLQFGLARLLLLERGAGIGERRTRRFNALTR